ncbi:hypothetical protein EJB05_49350, partial [Eragrostis curvula]
MGSSSDLTANWDFSHGRRFEQEVLQRFQSAVHHPSSSPDGSFFLLATFRRFTFRLTEDSVSLALQSCLGGSAPGFHVKFLSDRHFRFSVASKSVGFHVYNLRRFIGKTFDVYFHLWNNGVAHWERDKRIWEEETANEWTFVSYKKNKRSSQKLRKQVSFARRLVQDSPPVKYKPNLPPPTVKLGSLAFSLISSDGSGARTSFGKLKNVNQDHTMVKSSDVFSRLNKDLQRDRVLHDNVISGISVNSAKNTPQMHADPELAAVSSDKSSLNIVCSNCFASGHTRKECTSQIRCKLCYNYGHVARWCHTRVRPKLYWAPKSVTQPNRKPEDYISADHICTGNKGGSSSVSVSDQNTTDSDGDVDDMANFPCNPMLYAPRGAILEQGWHRPARERLALGGEPTRLHEDFGILIMNPRPADHHLNAALTDAVDFLELEYNVRIRTSCLSPLGLGLLQFASPAQRQTLIDLSPIPYGPMHHLSVIAHDRGRNLRACNYIRECTIMFVAFPLDYQTMEYIKAAVAPFGRLLYWDSNSANKSRVIVRVLVLSPNRIPRSLVVSEGSVLGGNGRSWSVPVYILNGAFPDEFPPGEDHVPLDGNPHPLPHHWPPPMGHHDHEPDWQHEVQGGLNIDLPEIGGHQQQHNAHDNLEDDWADEGLEDDDAGNNDGEVNNAQVFPDQAQVQADEIDFDPSGSTASYLRANGSDISIELVSVPNASVDHGESSSNSDATSTVLAPTVAGPALPPEMIMAEMVDKTMVITAHLMSKIVQRPLQLMNILQKRSWDSAFQPIIIPRVLESTPISLGETTAKNIVRKLNFEDIPVQNNMAIVPYKPVLPAVLMQLWAAQTEVASTMTEPSGATTETQDKMQEATDDTPIDETMNQIMGNTHDSVIQPENSVSKVSYPPPRPATSARKKIITAISEANTCNLLARRRSPRLKEQNVGYQHVRLEDTPRKRRRKTTKKEEANLVSKLDAMVGVISDDPTQMLPVALMQEVGKVLCQLPPEEIADGKLQATQVEKPKDKGGLGVINLRIQNKGLLMKFLDKFYNQRELPWVKLIWNTYYESEVPHMSRERGSFWWKDILRLGIEYRGISTCIVGRGNTVSFWHDLLHDEILSVKYPRLFSFAKNPNASVHEVINTESIEELFNLPLTQEALDELLLIQIDLEQLEENLERPDKWIYIWGSDTYKSCKYYKHNFIGLTCPQPFKWIWKSKCMPKIKFFIWLVLKDRVNTRNMLRRRNHHLESGYNCVLCHQDTEETLYHLFFDCTFSTSCWFSIGILWDGELDIHERVMEAKRQFQHQFFMEIFSIATWGIWKVRNAKIFDHKHPIVASWKQAFRDEIILHLYRIPDRHHQFFGQKKKIAILEVTRMDKIFLNGTWVGSCGDAASFVFRLRCMRRSSLIDRQTNDIVIGKVSETGEDHSIKLKHTEKGMVQKVLLSSNDQGKNFAVVTLRQVRSPCFGDKFSSMHGQKGVVGFLESQENFPFTHQGIVPDTVINPHSFPTRQTPGQLLEAALGKGIALGASVDVIAEQLHKAGFSRWGAESVLDGRTGERVKSLVFMGPTFYQRLIHMSEDKVKFRNTGPVNPLTTQLVADRKRFGGVKFGEMERDCLLAHGAAANLHERLFVLSDFSEMHVCQTCERVASASLQRPYSTMTASVEFRLE